MGGSGPPMTITHLWKGGRVFTGDAYHEAALVEDGRILFVGSLAEARRGAPTGTEEHDLAGGMLVPGVRDSHLHLAELALRAYGPEIRSVSSVEELVERTRAWAASHPTGPVVGRGWSLASLGMGEWPTRADLDRAEASRPAILYHVSGHAAVVNSSALHALSIDRSTGDPPGGRIGREADGEPNGQLFETALGVVSDLAHRAIASAPSTLDEVLRRLLALGITSVGTMNTGPSELQLLAARDATRPGPRIGIYLSLPWFASAGEAALRALPAASPHLRVAGVKGFADGAFGTRTAWLFEPYRDEPRNSGMPVHPFEEMVDGFRRARGLQLVPAVHALGDRGFDRALDVLERSRLPGTATGERVEHAGLLATALLPKLRRLRPTAVVQPSFIWTDHWLADRLGTDRAGHAYALRTLRAAGCTLAGSSDAPFDALDPWAGMRAAIHRTSPEGRSANPAPDQALTEEEAFAMYTVGGAKALGEGGPGILRPGAPADFVWLDVPSLPLAIARGADRIRETWVDGRRAHPAGGR